MRGDGDDQIMTITASDLPRPPAGVERAGGDRSRSDRSVLRGSYA
jgi:hypothetical protein